MPDPSPLQRFTDLSRLVHRENVVLLMLCAITIAVFTGTRTLAGLHERQRDRDANAWYAKGRQELDAGRFAEAVASFRRAATAEPANWTHARSLAQALTANGQLDAARRLLELWRDRRPQDPEIDAQLARIEARLDHRAEASRYYEAALYRPWHPSAAEEQRRLRLELIDYLLAHGDQPGALAQVLALAANEADSVDAHLETGRLFLAAGDPRRALDEYRRARRLAPANQAARDGISAATAAIRAQRDAEPDSAAP